MSGSSVQYFLNIIKSVLNGTQFQADSQGADFETLYALSKIHQLAGVVGFCPQALKQMPEDMAKKFIYEKNRSISREAVQDAVVSELLEKMEDAGIRALLLKGFCIKNMYPHPAIRYMTDTDILVDEKDIQQIKPVLEELGLKFDHDSPHEVIFSNQQMAVELHKTLIPASFGRLYEYYADPWRFAALWQGRQYIYEMSPEDFYVFTVGHIAKHYAQGGIGIKHIMDIYVMSKCEHDRDYINAQLEKLGLVKFERLVQRLAFSWFSEDNIEENDQAVRELAFAILESGAFGESEKRTASSILHKDRKSDKKASRLKMMLAKIFPSLEHMQMLFPALRRCAFLYPVFWFVRAFDIVFKRRSELDVLKNLATLGQDVVDDFADRLKRAGIPEDL